MRDMRAQTGAIKCDIIARIIATDCTTLHDAQIKVQSASGKAIGSGLRENA